MRSRYEVVITSAILASAELIWYVAHADQAAVDAGVDYAKSLVTGVQSLTSSTSAASVPGYDNTNLPQDYYSNQDLGGMQTDAVVNMGSASEAAQYGYDASFQPKLQFGGNDPMLLNSTSISTDTMLSPDVLTVETGNCTTDNAINGDTRVEHCTAWRSPTDHSCNNTLTVSVTYDDALNCTAGEVIDIQSVHLTGYLADYSNLNVFSPGENLNVLTIQAGLVCDPDKALPALAVRSNADASLGITPTYNEWFFGELSSAQSTTYSSISIFGAPGSSTYIPVIYNSATCNINNCSVSIALLSMVYCGAYCGGYGGGGFIPLPRPLFTPYTGLKPGYNASTPVITDSWSNGCGYLEAQVQ